MSCLLITVAGRFMFLSALITQTVMFAQYPSIYLESGWYNLLVLLAIPTLVVWFVILRSYDKSLQHMWVVWGFYVLTVLIPMVCLMYGRLREKLDVNQFFGPNILMMTTCITPAIAILLLTTASDAADDKIELFTQLCCGTVLDLFDDVEILDMLLFQNEKFDLPESLEIIIIVCVCISLLLSTLEMAEKKFDKDCGCKNREKVYCLRLLLQMFLVNIALLVIRLVVWFKYKHNASIFIAKNLIVIVMSMINMIRKIFH